MTSTYGMSRTRRRSRLLAPLVAAALLLTGCTEPGLQSKGDDDTQPWSQWKNPTTPAVTFSGTTTTGSTFRSKDFRGKVLVVNFWYAGCSPCRAEAPTLNSLAAKYEADGVQFVGVNISDDAGTATGFERTYKSTYPSIVDQEDGAAVQLAFTSSRPPKAVPSTLILDRAGRVTARVIGLANKSILSTLIGDAVAETNG